MANVILVVNGQKIIKEKIYGWLKEQNYKIVMLGLLSSTKPKDYQEERTCWRDLFALQEEFETAGFSVSIGTEKGSIFNIIATAQTLETEMLIMPKSKFLMLATDEFEDFLSQLPCSLMLY